MQICLAHGYGVDKQERCKNTLASVQALLGGQSIELYVEIPLDGIGALNDLLGGVTVTLLDDFTASDPTMTARKDADADRSAGGDSGSQPHVDGSGHE